MIVCDIGRLGRLVHASQRGFDSSPGPVGNIGHVIRFDPAGLSTAHVDAGEAERGGFEEAGAAVADDCIGAFKQTDKLCARQVSQRCDPGNGFNGADN